MKPAIDIVNLSKQYGDHKALDDLNLTIPEGSLFGLLGPNGAGKTTLIRIINQIIEQDYGQVKLFGKDLKPEDIRQVGYLPEERGLYKKMKVGEQALYLAQLKGMPHDLAKSRLKDWFIRWDMTSWWDKKIEELSKGMAQKIQFITTVLHEPKLLIFDEPFSGFDPVNAQLIQEEMLRLNREGATIIFSTHRMESVEELCTDIVLIDQGKKVLEGNIHDVKDRHRNGSYRLTYRAVEPIAFELIDGVTATDSSVLRSGLHQQAFKVIDGLANALIHSLNQQCDIMAIEEVIPSIHDIFVQAVSPSHS